VIDTSRAFEKLREFAIDALGLTLVDTSGPIELYAAREPIG
jgi:hypothetical protein